jgi:guanine deaminase
LQGYWKSRVTLNPRVKLTPVLLRAPILHTPRNPFKDAKALETFSDGGLLIQNGQIVALGNFADIQAAYPNTNVQDLRGGVLLPGFIDTHIHYPQVRVVGGLGMTLLDWLETNTLPEEARFGDAVYARAVAKEFLYGLASHGTTTALVFGCHFVTGQAELFQEAQDWGLRIVSGLVLSDRMLRDELHQTPEAAYQGSTKLIKRFHGQGKLLYAITPRFSLSTSEAMLEVCQTLQREHQGLRFTSHINENDREIAAVKEAFPWAKDYLETYERFDLVHRHSVFAHSVHPSDNELSRMGALQASASHCPCSNASLGSGIFPMARHLQHQVHFALGTDIGGGTGFGILKEALQAYFLQRLKPNGTMLTAAHMLYLSTRAGAEALGLENLTGDLSVGKAADLVYLRPPEKSPLAAFMKHAPSPERMLSGIFAMAGSESIARVWVAGKTVYGQEVAV